LNAFEFISSLIKSLAWPIVVLTIVILLRQPIIRILSSLNKVTFNNFEMDFEQKLNEIESSLEDKQHTFNLDEETNKQEEQIKQVAEVSPNASITMAWSMVEKEIQSTIQRLAISSDYHLNNSAFKNIALLKQEEILDPETFNTLNELRYLRNRVTHNQLPQSKITYLDAIKYYELALKVVMILKNIQR
jgi:uncharacterized protein YutE (UPF0331/DUF86 family)